jgi:hypothetical protein
MGFLNFLHKVRKHFGGILHGILVMNEVIGAGYAVLFILRILLCLKSLGRGLCKKGIQVQKSTNPYFQEM